MEQLKSIGRELAMTSQGGFNQSKEFLDLVKAIGEARSKAEEDRIVLREIETLKRRISEPDTPKRKMKEYIIRLVYIEMLGHDASFGYIHAVKMTHDETLALKRTGYLAVTLFLNEDHDLIILIVNTIQKDLKSDNYLVVCAALNAVCRLINEETIPAVLPQVVELLGHSKEAVRKKAIMALHRFHLRSPGSVNHVVANFRKRLCDNDPGVMGATLCPLYDLIKLDANPYKDLVVSFVNILKQVAERRLPKTYDYHQMPAPFIQKLPLLLIAHRFVRWKPSLWKQGKCCLDQPLPDPAMQELFALDRPSYFTGQGTTSCTPIKLLKILAILGAGDKHASEHMYTVVGDAMRKCDSLSNIGNAVLYECLCCVSSIYPNTKLLETAADAISKFLKNDTHNLKYMGIDALSRLIKLSPDIAEQHQLAVIDCLEDPDDTLKRKTFELLYKMTKSSNVEVIVDRMIDYMVNINDNHYKSEIASRCVELAEQFAPSNQWFIQTMNRVFEHAGDLLDAKLAHNLMRLIAEGFKEEDNTGDSQLRSSAVGSYLHIIGEPKLPSSFLQVICWVLGEYGTADGNYSASYVSGKLCDVAESHSADDTIKAYALTALMKIYAFEKAAGRKVDMLPECQSLVEELSASHSTDLQQRAYELQALVELDVKIVKNVMPIDASCEDIEIDKSLPFLNDHIQQSIEKGAQPYISENERVGVLEIATLGNQMHHETSSHHSLRFEAYELPKPVISSMSHPVSLSSSSELVPVPKPSYPTEFHQTSPVPSISNASSTQLKLRLDGIQKKWGKPSYSPSPPSASSSNFQQPVNGVAQSDVAGNTSTKVQYNNSYETRHSHTEVISEEKQKLAASLFGGPSKPEKRPASTSRQVPKSNTTAATYLEPSREKPTVPLQPPPDLLDLSDMSSVVSSAPSVDPFKQLEGLLDLTHDALPVNQSSGSSSKSPDLMSLYEDMTISNGDGSSMMTGLSNASASTVAPPTQLSKGPNLKDALEKDALARQMGVNLTNRNPNLFSDLLG